MAIHTEYSVRTNSPYPTSTRSSTRLPASERKACRRRPPESLSTTTPQASSCEPSPRRAEPSPAAPSQLPEYALNRKSVGQSAGGSIPAERQRSRDEGGQVSGGGLLEGD